MSLLDFIIIFLGAVFIIKSLCIFMSLHRLKRWNQVDIKILKLDVIVEKELSLHSSLFRYYPCLEFEYKLDGLLFQNNKISIDKNREWSYYEDETNDLLKKLGERKVAYVNPKYSPDSVLMHKLLPKSLSHYLALLVSGVALLAIGIVSATF